MAKPFFSSSVRVQRMAPAGDLPHDQLPEFVLYALGRKGKTAAQLHRPARGAPDAGDPYADMPVWHKAGEIIEYLAGELKLHRAMYGPKRESNEFYDAVYSELAKLKNKETAVSLGRSGVFRLASPGLAAHKPVLSMKMGDVAAPAAGDKDLRRPFLSILAKGVKANTYKFALARALLDYSSETIWTGASTYEVPYQYLASKFLKYYWHQECKFRIRQSFQTKSDPNAIKAIRKTFGDRAGGRFSELDPADVARAERAILRSVFGHARSSTSQVVPRFQKIKAGKRAQEMRVFYEYNDDKKMLYLRGEAFDFFKSNYGILSRAVLAEWARFLEKINGSLPRLVSKIDQDSFERGSLAPIRAAYLRHTCHCFYCQDKLERRYIHVDHLIPWSYIFEDEPWNLVLACRDCNLKKSDSLPQEEFCRSLISRNRSYRGRIRRLNMSILSIASKRSWEDEIQNHYDTCAEYGFGRIKMP